MKERNRALKRHHDARIKVKRTQYVNTWTEATRPVRVPTDKEIGRKACTPTNCSCYMCGNPRKYDGELTREEKGFLDIEKDQIENLKSDWVYHKEYDEWQKYYE